MTSLIAFLTVLGGLLGLVAVLGVIYVYFRGSADKATIESQGRLIVAIKDENGSLTHRVEVLERENADLRVAVAEVRGITELRDLAESIKLDTAAIRLAVA